MAKYISNRQQNIKIGIVSYTEGKTVLEVTGKVGIGTTNATSKLHVIGDARVTGVVTASSFSGDGSQLTGVTGTQIVTQDPISTPVFLTFANNTGVTSLGVATTGSNVLSVIPSLGNLGIGTTNPTSKLWVNGDGYFVGVLTANRIFSSTYGEFVGGSISGTNLVGTSLSISGISTLGVTSATNLTSQQLNVSGIITVGFVTASNIYSSGVVTATTFYGTFAGNASSATFATNAGIATNLKGGVIGNIPYQSAADTTAFLINGDSGTILQSNGVGNLPTWVTPAPAAAITGLTIRDEGTVVGGANSVTALNFVGSIVSVASTAGIATITFLDYVSNAGIATYATNAGTSTSVIGGIASVTQLYVSSGITTVGFITASSAYVTGVTTSGGVNVTTGNDYKVNNNSVLTNDTLGSGVVNSSLTSVGTLGQLNVSGITTLGVTSTTNLTSQQLNVSGISTFSNGPVLVGTGTSTGTSGQVLQVSGINSSVYIGGSVGIGTTNPTSKLWVNGDGYFTGILTANRIFSSTYGEFVGGSISGTAIVGTSLSVSGISTFTSGPILVGTGTSTGTASQPLQVTGGAYVSGNLGIGTTNPTSALTVTGNGTFTGVVTATTFVGALTGTATTATNAQGLTGTPNITVGVATASRLNVGTGGTVITTITSGLVGIGTTNPTSKLTVVGVVSATSFSGSGTNLTGIVTSIVAGTNITVSGSTGQVTVNSTASGGAALDILEVMLFA